MYKMFKYIFVGAIILGCIISLMVFHSNKDNHYAYLQAQHSQAVVSQQAYYNKQNSILNSINKDAATSKNPKLKAFGQNNLAIDAITNPINNFFNIMYDWNNESQFNSRKIHMRKLATPKALNIEPITKSDKDYSGQSEIKNLDLHSNFVSSTITSVNQKGTIIQALCSATYYTKSGAKHNNGQQWYLITLNTKINKITNIKLVYTNENNQYEGY